MQASRDVDARLTKLSEDASTWSAELELTRGQALTEMAAAKAELAKARSDVLEAVGQLVATQRAIRSDLDELAARQAAAVAAAAAAAAAAARSSSPSLAMPTTVDAPPRLLVMTYMDSLSSLACASMRSAVNAGIELRILGLDDPTRWAHIPMPVNRKVYAMESFLLHNTSAADDDTVLLFVDGFDVLYTAQSASILESFLKVYISSSCAATSAVRY